MPDNSLLELDGWLRTEPVCGFRRGCTRAEFARYVADEHAFWGRKLKALKIDME